jgi:N-acetylglutamate synthase
MQITRADRVRMERAHVQAWPALRTADIDGWLWRSSGGGSQRANSVSTIDFTGADMGAAVKQVEARYHAVGAPARFHTFDETSPPDLGDLLQRRGYTQGEPTVTMFNRTEIVGIAADVEVRNHAWPDWQAVYLGEITENRRTVNAEILRRIPRPRAFFGYRKGNEIVSSALCVIACGCAVIECVTTRFGARRQGAARVLLTALQHWAKHQGTDLIGLQVVAGNRPAVTLYKQLGFVDGATNSFWLARSPAP